MDKWMVCAFMFLLLQKGLFFSLVQLILGVVILSETIESTIKMWEFLFFSTVSILTLWCDSLLHKCSVPSYSSCSVHSQNSYFTSVSFHHLLQQIAPWSCNMNLISFKGFCSWRHNGMWVFFLSSSSILYSQVDILYQLIRSKAMCSFLVSGCMYCRVVFNYAVRN